MSKLYRASKDCVCFVNEIGNKLRSVIPDYQKFVLGDMQATGWRDQEASRGWIQTFLQVHARFEGRDFRTAKLLEGGPQYRIAEREIACLWELAQLLVDMDSDTHFAKTRERPPRVTVPRVFESLIEPERIIA